MAIKSSDQISLVDLTDGFSVILTNDSYTFPGTTNAAKAGSATTTIVAMCGADQIPAAVDNSKIIAPTGVTTSVDTDATQPTVTISVTTAVKTGGTVDIPVSLDGGNIIIHKYFTFQIAFTGATGAAGSSAQWYSGTKITGTSTTATIFSDSGITAAKVGDMYLNTDTMNTYRCTVAGAASAAKWVYVGNIKGATGETGAGAIWYTGTKITGTSTTATIFSGSGITNAKVGDMYLNTSTYNTYRCTVAGAAAAAKWVYVNNIKGAKGDQGNAGVDAITMTITSSNGTIFKNTAITTTLTAHVYKAGAELDATAIAALGTIKWYKDGSTMLTLLASFAQEEITSLSNNVKWGIRKRFEKGIPNFRNKILGYEWEGDHLVVVPEEAAIVKRIFQNFLDGKSRLETERELNGEGITTKAGCKWCDSNIKVVLSNITYTGNLLLQKEYIEDPITKKRRKNKGELPQYFVENTHEAIIDMETFQYVQNEMARRRKLGALANKSLNTCCFTGKIKCPYCGFSYMHHIRKRENGTENYWKCGTTKKKDGRCPVKGGIRDDKLRIACADALGLDEFDETAFLAQVDHIEVPKRYQIEIHMKDGRIIQKNCTPTGHQDCWTQEYRDKVSEQRRKNGTNPKGASCFTAKIKCAECGNNYRRQTRKRSTGEKYYLFACATTKECSNNCIHEDVLKELAAEALGLSAFDDAAFTDLVDHVDIAPGGHITFFLKDGTSKAMTYSTKRRMPKWTDERRKKQGDAIRASFTDERRQRMSETMKKVRRERYWHSTGKSKRSQQP